MLTSSRWWIRLLSEFRRLDRTEQGLVITVAAALPLTRLLLAVVGLERTRRISTRFLRWTAKLDVTNPNQLAWAIRAGANVIPVEITCLPRAVVGQALFEAHDYETSLRFGVRQDTGDLLAHAWVEHAGEVVVGADEDPDRFHPLTR